MKKIERICTTFQFLAIKSQARSIRNLHIQFLARKILLERAELSSVNFVYVKTSLCVSVIVGENKCVFYVLT